MTSGTFRQMCCVDLLVPHSQHWVANFKFKDLNIQELSFLSKGLEHLFTLNNYSFPKTYGFLLGSI